MGPKMTPQDPSQRQPASNHVRKQAETTDDSCIDDPKWVDRDGDGCAVYATHIQNNEISQKEACEYSDGAAKMHCPATCGLCNVQQGLIKSLLGSLAESKPAVNPYPAVRLEAAKHPDVQALLKSLDANKQCKDDPKWVDADGDNCAVYADHITSKLLSQDQACMYGDGGARDHCRLTCGTCDSRSNHVRKGKGKGQKAKGKGKGKGKGRFGRLWSKNHKGKVKGKSKADVSAPAPIPSPYRARASPKMVPSAQEDASPAASDACIDDQDWVDQDGDSCAVYADKIKSGEFLLAEACSYQDEVAKKHCPMTCNMCRQKAETPSSPPTLAKKEACIDDPDWVDQDGDGCVAYATAIRAGTFDQEEACGYSDGKAKAHCRATCDTCPQTEHTAVHQNLLAHHKPMGPKMVPQDSNALVKKAACVDDPDWADQDGDDCAAYAKAIKDGHITQLEACGFSGGKAKQHCLVTCNACPRTHSSHQNLLHQPPKSTQAVEAAQFV